MQRKNIRLWNGVCHPHPSTPLPPQLYCSTPNSCFFLAAHSLLPSPTRVSVLWHQPTAPKQGHVCLTFIGEHKNDSELREIMCESPTFTVRSRAADAITVKLQLAQKKPLSRQDPVTKLELKAEQRLPVEVTHTAALLCSSRNLSRQRQRPGDAAPPAEGSVGDPRTAWGDAPRDPRPRPQRWAAPPPAPLRASPDHLPPRPRRPLPPRARRQLTSMILMKRGNTGLRVTAMSGTLGKCSGTSSGVNAVMTGPAPPLSAPPPPPPPSSPPPSSASPPDRPPGLRWCQRGPALKAARAGGAEPSGAGTAAAGAQRRRRVGPRAGPVTAGRQRPHSRHQRAAAMLLARAPHFRSPGSARPARAGSRGLAHVWARPWARVRAPIRGRGRYDCGFGHCPPFPFLLGSLQSAAQTAAEYLQE